MKRLLTIFITVLLACTSCSNQYMDDLVTLHRKLHDVTELSEANKARMDAINSSLEILVALADVLSEGFYVESMKEIKATPENQGGWLITFSNGKSVSIYNGSGGSDAFMPKLSIGLDADGRYYWLLGTDWVLDEDGHKVPVTSDKKVPIVDIRNGYWYISYNNGDTWQLLGRATGEDGYDGEYGANPIVGIDASAEDFVTFTMANGNTFIVPIRQQLKLILDTKPEDCLISAWETIKIGYSLSRKEEGAYVAVESDGFYTAVVKQTGDLSGEILITCPRAYEEGYVNVLLYSDAGISDLKVVNLVEKKMSITGGTEYTVGVDGGILVIPYTSNFKFSLHVNDAAASWLKPYLRDGKIYVEVPANKGMARSGVISVMSDNGTLPFASITVTQASSSASIDKGSFVLEYGGGTVVSKLVTTYGVKVQIPAEDEDWISCTVNQGDTPFEYSLYFSVDVNRFVHERSSDIKILSADGTKEIALVHISQLCRMTDISDAMIVKVRPNYSNDFTAAVPIYMHPYDTYARNLDCYIDWGDGTGNHVTCPSYDDWAAGNRYASHKYSNVVPGQTFEVVITGTVPSFSASEVPALYKTSIVEIEQWGKLGTVSMYRAFYGYSAIQNLPLDDNDCFSLVTDFSDAFESCTGLQSVSEKLFAHADRCTSFYGVFYNCNSLSSVPPGLFSKCISATDFTWAFYNCQSLQSVPEKLFAGCVNAERFSYTFYNASSLKTVPAGLFKDCTRATVFMGCFMSSGMESIPAELLANCKDVTNVSQMFESCSRLSTVPVSLFDNNRRLTNVNSLFGWCGREIMKGESPYTVINGKKVHLYERSLYPDDFVTPADYKNCFYYSGFSDEQAMPKAWSDYSY